MRIALKITLALTLWTVAVLLVMHQRELADERELIDRDMQDELLLMGRALRPLLVDAWARGGDEQVSAALSAAYASEKEVRLRWLGPGLGSPPPRPAAATRAIQQRQEQVVMWPRPTAPEVLFAYVPVRLDSGQLAVVELRRALDLRVDLARRKARQLAVTVAIIGTCSAIMAVLLGWLVVGQRVGRLVRLARTVGRGGAPVPVPTKARDELSDLARAMNAMIEDLERAREQSQREATQRARLTQELRHVDRLATIGTMMSRIAHEIGTPLNVISARTKLIARGQVSGDAVVDNARIAAEQSDRIATIVRGFLDFSRKSREPHQSFPALRVIEHAQTLLDTHARARDVDLIIAARAPDAEIRGDLLLLQQAVTNLLVNAIDAAPPHTHVTVDLAVQTATPPEGRGRGPGTYVSITVGDRGPGIDPAIVPSLFEPFVTTKPSGAGTGLGLSIAAGIVHDHGGWIDVLSEPGGTQVIIRLPLAHATTHE